MTSLRETALLALHQRLQTLSGPAVLRNEVLPGKVPAGGLVILRDGEPVEPAATGAVGLDQCAMSTGVAAT